MSYAKELDTSLPQWAQRDAAIAEVDRLRLALAAAKETGAKSMSMGEAELRIANAAANAIIGQQADEAKKLSDALAASRDEAEKAKAGMIQFSKSFEKVENENSDLEAKLAASEALNGRLREIMTKELPVIDRDVDIYKRHQRSYYSDEIVAQRVKDLEEYRAAIDAARSDERK